MVNAAAYCCLLPLWEGFDEAYHYGYVQYLSTNLRFPVLGRATLSREIWHSFELVPVSHYLQPFTHAPVSFLQYFTFSEQERVARRQQLETIPPHEKFESQPDKPNYEVNQSPVPYLLLAVADRGLSERPIPDRVLVLRLMISLTAVVLLVHATFLLASEFALPPAFTLAVLFCALSSQMLYATLCRVSNDPLAPPAMAYLLLAAIRAHRSGTPRSWLALGLAMAVALLIKAYFLFLLPLPAFLIAWALWRRRAAIAAMLFLGAPLALLAGPWYARNLWLYHDLSATSEKTAGLGAGALISAAIRVHWIESIRYMAHSSLWTGNNSFTTFSAATLNVVLLLLALGVALCFIHAQRDGAEWIVVAAVVLFSSELALITVIFFAATQGQAFAAVPWYMQVLLVPVLLLAFLGLARSGKWGARIAAASVLLWAYVIGATYLAKLIPMYGGFPAAHAHVRDLWDWYLHNARGRDAILATVCPGNVTALKLLATGALILDIALCAATAHALLHAHQPPATGSHR